MEIQYQRNLKNSYMVVIEPEQPLNMDGQLAEKMMQRQDIRGLLSWVSMEHERDMTFWYRITGLQSLSDWLKHHTLSHELIERILSGLLALQEELPRYYLKPEHVLLHEEQIFLTTSGEQIYFCYEPLWRKEPILALQELMEHLLPQIDHSDAEAVRLGYGVYEKSQEENADIWCYLMNEHIGNPRKNQAQEWYACETAPVSLPEEPVTSEESKPRKKRIGKNLKVPEFMQEWMQSGTSIVQQLPFRTRLAQKEPVAVYSFEPEETPAVSENPTIYMGSKKNAVGKLLYQGIGQEGSFEITGDTFLLGSRNEQADGHLISSEISRTHARITKTEGTYYIEDLNSRNGTFLNGELLSYKERYRIQPGDHVRFAGEEYVFY